MSRREFWKLLSEFLSRGLTIVMSTPYLDEAERCARVALLHDGRLLAIDRPDRLQSRLSGAAARGLRRRAAAADRCARGVAGVVDVQSFGDRAHVRVAAGQAAAGAPRRSTRALNARGFTGVSVRPIAASLEDVFIDLIGPQPEPDGDDG